MSKFVKIIGASRSPYKISGRDDINISATMAETPSRTIKTSTHPVEEGVDITDHAVREPDSLSLSVVLAEPEDLDRLYILAAARKLVDVIGALMVYTNMLLKSVRPSRTAGEGYLVMVELEFEEIIIVRSTAISLPEEQQRSAGRQPSGKSKDDGTAGALAVGADAAGAAAAGAVAGAKGKGKEEEKKKETSSPNGSSLAKDKLGGHLNALLDKI